MDDSLPPGHGPPQEAPDERLDSWKRIAAYLRRDVTTVQRWERREGMPVHRHLHDKQGSVFAYRSELDAWWAGRPAPGTEGAGTEAAAAASATTATQSSGRPPGRSMPVRMALLVLMVLAIGALISWLIATRHNWHDPLEQARYSALPVSSLLADQSAQISPDGRMLAFLASQNGVVDVWTGQIGSGSYRNVTEGRFAELVNPAIRPLGFSPDSKQLSFWSRRGDGSAPGDVARFAAPTAGGSPASYLPLAAEFAWSDDGRHVVFHTTAPGDPIFISDSVLSEPRQVFVGATGEHCHYPIWSPDGAYIYFVRGVPPNDWDVWRIRPSGSGLERLTNHASRISYPVMLDANTLLYLLSDSDGAATAIYAIDVDRRVPHRISAGSESYTALSASADGRRLVASLANAHTSLWRIPLRADAVGHVAAGAPMALLTDAGTPRAGPGFLVFVSGRGGSQGLWKLANGVTRQIWADPHAAVAGAPAVAQDGRIAFVARFATRSQVIAVDPEGAHPRVLADSLQLRGNPAWAPDGRSLTIAAIQAGQPRLMRVFADSAPPQPFLAEYSTDPVWSPDGRFLIYAGANVGTTFPLRAAAADGRPYALPGIMLTRGAHAAFLDDSGALLVARGSLGHTNIWRLDLHAVTESLLVELPPDFVVGDFTVEEDGSALIVERVEDSTYLTLIERPDAAAR